MTTATNTDTRVESRKTDPEPSREVAFIRRLIAAHHSGGSAQLRRWQPGTVDVAMIALTQDATVQEYPAWALTAKLFVTLNTKDPTKELFGYGGTGIGKWAFFSKPRLDSGAPNPQAERILNALIRAQTFEALDQAMTALARMTTDTLPGWFRVLDELTQWCDPQRRDAVRYRWAQDFHTPYKRAPKSKDTSTGEDTTGKSEVSDTVPGETTDGLTAT